MGTIRELRGGAVMGVFVVFEGIDGSGKTTLSNGVARLLREGGLRVDHVREGGTFASSVTQAIRELGRDAKNVELTPHAELLLYTTRDVQLLDEATRPALERADVVIADRFLYSAEVLARHGRGLPESDVMPILRAAARGLVPDLVVLVDIDPHLARARRRVAKILKPDPRPSSRKGLAGVGMQHRLREGYLELARREPDRWIVVDNGDANLETLTAELAALIATARGRGVAAAREQAPSPPARRPSSVDGLERAVEAFLKFIDRRSLREPDLAAYFLAGLHGREIDERRQSLAERSPLVIATGLKGMTDEVSIKLRRVLADKAPGPVARSLAPPAGFADGRLLVELSQLVPGDVALALDGRDDAQAWLLRERIFPQAPDAVVSSLRRVDTSRAWTLRGHWLASRGGAAALATYELARAAATSVQGLDDPRAWELRKTARAAAPVPAIESILGLTSETSWKWRHRWVARAPKPVLRSLTGLDDDRAWALREATAPRCKEAIDSIAGLDGERAWALREAHADTWPSTVVKSLGPLGASARGKELVVRQLGRHADNPSLLKHAVAVALGVTSTEEE
jgi:dTMP kinase